MRYSVFKWVFFASVVLNVACGDSKTRVCFNTGGGCDLFTADNAPRADAGSDTEAAPGETVVLDGSGSRAEGDPADFVWAQESGPAVAIVNATQAIASFVAPNVQDTELLVFRLVVTDENRRTDDDVIRITIVPVAMTAMLTGLERLQKQLVPKPLIITEPMVSARTISDPEFTGLWLAVRTLASELLLDGAPVKLLDELRAVTYEVVVQHGAPQITTLLVMGLKHTSLYTRERDPLTHEWSQLGLRRTRLAQADSVGQTVFALLGDTRLPVLIEQATTADDPLIVAAATLVLLEGIAKQRCGQNRPEVSAIEGRTMDGLVGYRLFEIETIARASQGPSQTSSSMSVP